MIGCATCEVMQASLLTLAMAAMGTGVAGSVWVLVDWVCALLGSAKKRPGEDDAR